MGSTCVRLDAEALRYGVVSLPPDAITQLLGPGFTQAGLPLRGVPLRLAPVERGQPPLGAWLRLKLGGAGGGGGPWQLEGLSAWLQRSGAAPGHALALAAEEEYSPGARGGAAGEGAAEPARRVAAVWVELLRSSSSSAAVAPKPAANEANAAEDVSDWTLTAAGTVARVSRRHLLILRKARGAPAEDRPARPGPPPAPPSPATPHAVAADGSAAAANGTARPAAGAYKKPVQPAATGGAAAYPLTTIGLGLIASAASALHAFPAQVQAAWDTSESQVVRLYGRMLDGSVVPYDGVRLMALGPHSSSLGFSGHGALLSAAGGGAERVGATAFRLAVLEDGRAVVEAAPPGAPPRSASRAAAVTSTPRVGASPGAASVGMQGRLALGPPPSSGLPLLLAALADAAGQQANGEMVPAASCLASGRMGIVGAGRPETALLAIADILGLAPGPGQLLSPAGAALAAQLGREAAVTLHLQRQQQQQEQYRQHHTAGDRGAARQQGGSVLLKASATGSSGAGGLAGRKRDHAALATTREAEAAPGAYWPGGTGGGAAVGLAAGSRGASHADSAGGVRRGAPGGGPGRAAACTPGRMAAAMTVVAARRGGQPGQRPRPEALQPVPEEVSDDSTIVIDDSSADEDSGEEVVQSGGGRAAAPLPSSAAGAAGRPRASPGGPSAGSVRGSAPTGGAQARGPHGQALAGGSGAAVHTPAAVGARERVVASYVLKAKDHCLTSTLPALQHAFPAELRAARETGSNQSVQLYGRAPGGPLRLHHEVELTARGPRRCIVGFKGHGALLIGVAGGPPNPRVMTTFRLTVLEDGRAVVERDEAKDGTEQLPAARPKGPTSDLVSTALPADGAAAAAAGPPVPVLRPSGRALMLGAQAAATGMRGTARRPPPAPGLEVEGSAGGGHRPPAVRVNPSSPPGTAPARQGQGAGGAQPSELAAPGSLHPGDAGLQTPAPDPAAAWPGLPAASITHLHGYVRPGRGLPPLRPGELRLCGLTFHPAVASFVRAAHAQCDSLERSQQGPLLLHGQDSHHAAAAAPAAALQLSILGVDAGSGGAGAEAFLAHGLDRGTLCASLACLLWLAGQGGGEGGGGGGGGAAKGSLPEGTVARTGLAARRDPGGGEVWLEATEPIGRGAAVCVVGGYVMRRGAAEVRVAAGPGVLPARSGGAGGGIGAGPRRRWWRPWLSGGSLVLSQLGYGGVGALVADPLTACIAAADRAQGGTPPGPASQPNCAVLAVCARGVLLPVLVALRDIGPGERLLRGFGAGWCGELAAAWEGCEGGGAARDEASRQGPGVQEGNREVLP
ncbi:hypothetical protein HYH03_006573 [Edaphochlamys debaryana]|uniref:Uncharacterized protein n=1 Tax=Edaphochlamys debaryana TaxID=47281 RepID=A0A835Y3J2_9CHLO|nr:hypothetical protein HYH03_006573 [Edaphochlamys debaryana]|eukprot:KAG2495301.1 hypothetical protein HYH03_006573 [Edaphochlamys debaryana]